MERDITTSRSSSYFQVDRRQELRTFADAQVIVVCSDPGRKVGAARLIDQSANGLRIRHDLSLHKDDVVTIMTPEVDIRARVVWVAGDGTRLESGLEVIERR